MKKKKLEPTIWIQKKLKAKNDADQFVLDNRFQRACCHEFGHALGFEHSHFDPEFLKKLDLKEVKGEGLIKEVEECLNDKYDENGICKKVIDGKEVELRKTQFDPKSIMNYTFPKTWYKQEYQNEEEILTSNEPSEMDKEALKLAYS